MPPRYGCTPHIALFNIQKMPPRYGCTQPPHIALFNIYMQNPTYFLCYREKETPSVPVVMSKDSFV